MPRAIPEVDRELEDRIRSLGYELVQVEWAGSSHRPILRIRIDVTGTEGSEGVTVGDCATVSRALEPWLDGLERVPERYVLEVSSPGLERPLTKRADFARFAGRRVALKGKATLAGRAARLEGELLGVAGEEGSPERVRLRLSDGEEVEIPREDIERAHIVHQWK